MNHLFMNNQVCSCFHCGAVERVLPNDLNVAFAHMKAFDKAHKNCALTKAGAELFLKTGPAPKDTAAKLRAPGKVDL